MSQLTCPRCKKDVFLKDNQLASQENAMSEEEKARYEKVVEMFDNFFYSHNKIRRLGWISSGDDFKLVAFLLGITLIPVIAFATLQYFLSLSIATSSKLIFYFTIVQSSYLAFKIYNLIQARAEVKEDFIQHFPQFEEFRGNL